MPVLCLLLTITAFCLLTPLATGQDIVVHQSTSGSTVRREGTISAWSGLTLRLEHAGRTRDFDGDKIIAIETQWPDDYQKGLNELARRDYSSALNSFSNAIRQERRPWAQNIIRSKQLACCLATEELTSAAQIFFKIIASDPQSRFLPLCPLRWTGNQMGMNQSAADWIKSDEPIVQLLGASWRIGTDSTARRVLEDLTGDIDPTVAGLAVGQLWNARQTAMSAAEIDVWLKKFESLPISVRAGACFAIAAAQKRSGFKDAAIASYMRVVILHPDQPLVAAPALYQAATLLHNTGRSDGAAKLMAELQTKYPASNWAGRKIIQ